MSFFKLFSAKSPEVYEQKGDAYCAEGLWGNAKVEYERALNRLEKTQPLDGEAGQRLQEKVGRVREALALEHQNSAQELIAGGYQEEARDLLELALELTRDASAREVLQEKIQELEQHSAMNAEFSAGFHDIDEGADGMGMPDHETEHFFALCATLPDEIQMAYLGYGQHFKTGFLALNAGDFQGAAQYLSLALEENSGYDTFIPLELATAYLNQGKQDAAQQLLVPFLESHPDTLPGYQLLCEILWEKGAFDQAEELLARIPEDLQTSVAVCLLQGETLCQAGAYAEARAFYSRFLERYGWNESVALALAKTHEAMGNMDAARSIYGNIIDNCCSCHARIDPRVKEKYADLCFASGARDTSILELYLSLAQEIPGKASIYYHKVSSIYASQGNQTESMRFRSFAEQLDKETRETP